MRKGVPVLLAFFLFAAFGCAQKNIGQPAPDFTLPVLSENHQIVTLSTVAEKQPVLLTFWASWCPSCVEEIPRLNEWQGKYASKGLAIYGVDVQEPKDRVQQFVKAKEIRYPILLDEDGQVASRFGLVGLPASVLVAKGGKILYYGFSLPSNLDQWIDPKETRV